MKPRLPKHYIVIIFYLLFSNYAYSNDYKNNTDYKDSTLIVHEWGTITNQHKSDGSVIGHLNKIDADEVLPTFVHKYEPVSTNNSAERQLAKSPVTPGRPDVTMRLETPVIYFYPAKDQPLTNFNVEVSFRGGILNEFYPNANASVALDFSRIQSKQQAGIIEGWNGDVLNNFVIGKLSWQDIHTTNKQHLPETTSKVWLAPRNVSSMNIENSEYEVEKYLFYRGVGHLNALMQTTHNSQTVSIKAPEYLHWLHNHMTLQKVWLVDVLENGTIAFRAHNELIINKEQSNQLLLELPRFAEQDYSEHNQDLLRSSIQKKLTDMGLYKDEAIAMLDTWQSSYFEKAGLRIFYTVPQAWLDYHLPLNISIPNDMTRVLIGRIDLKE